MKILATAAMMLISTGVFAWDGYNSDSSSYVEIGAGNLVRPGQDIEVYDYGTGSYKEVEVQSMNGSGSGTEVEVYDSGSGEYQTYEME
jgi:pyruvate/2-oxoglutarate/acetoin dehydrogenase E1 component